MELQASMAVERLWSPGLRRVVLLSALLAALSLLPVLFLMPLFNAPFERDQGLYGVIARGWLDGSIPYRDLWDNKPPLLYLWYVGAFKLFGETVVAPRLLAAFAAAASLPFVWDSARILLGSRRGLFAALLFALAFANPFLQANANAEILMLLPLAAGFWAVVRGAGGSEWWFLPAGLFTALAVLTKQAAALPLVGYALWLGVLAARNPDERTRHVRSLTLLGLGTALGVAPFVGYFYAHGALDDFWYATVHFNFLFSGDYPFYSKLVPPLLLNPPPLFGGLFLWALALLGGLRLWQRRDRVAGLLLTFAVSSELATHLLGKTSPHYNVGLLPAAAVLGAIGLDSVIDGWRAGRRRQGYALAACALIAAGVSLFLYARPDADDRFLVQYTYTDYTYRSLDARVIADEVAALTAPDDYVYEFGRQSDIYFLADRRPASRWVHNRAYGIYPSMMAEVMRDLELRRPKVVLLTYKCEPSSEEFDGCRSGPPVELRQHLDAHYRYAGRVEYAELYLRVDAAASRPPAPTNTNGDRAP